MIMHYSKHVISSLFLLFLGVSSINADQRFSCNTLQLNNAEPLVEDMIDRILTIGNIKQDYHICRLPHSANAAAVIYDNKRVIAYDPVFLHRLALQANEQYWAKVMILAHEIGHHRFHHTDKLSELSHLPEDKRNEIQREYELQADTFAARILANMGASLDNTRALITSLTLHVDESESTHPSANHRNSAVTQGWNTGCQEAGNDCNSHHKTAQRDKKYSPLGRNATTNYMQFIRYANRLKGKRVNRHYCNQYATLAVKQTRRSQQAQCHFNVNIPNGQWSTSFTPQVNWCMKSSAYATTNEAQFRETKLASCVP